MGQHRLPAIANRLRINRGFNSAWYSDFHYAQLLQKDWLLTRSAQSLVQRSSRSRPRQRLTLSQQLQLLEALRAARAEGRDLDVQAAAAQAIAASTSGQAQGLSMCDYPNLRVGRIFTQHLPYKSIVSTFAYSVPEQGPQNKYGLLPRTQERPASAAPSGKQQQQPSAGESSRQGGGGKPAS
uniref:Uncharacterized protein n=1 Tax=Dunaliella tertiolecta TaxID=3047 RepID=A0A7S3QKK2_DUNTE|mmetsp:Transcript_27911/g.75418  ORF Transcript_27911/g.75418 Transcript_27911/m.75418 type:complete len:182 (-) Transcript_27911:932-1477(-)|eukprot:CAMPEP_0202348338 /NCGR_PEP_ID=MMETSP1126-20121109/6310_1 /ASSEMBLY_ACC=CAM_ASM_000457 /TAXON_ID=3047 /ORGANISM="Dunaliella tertiolecta, Strain CCMP1320" /LENGTH=181 /DNA_ID=CAMNT_0048940009 /DNA_START=79 /DNA_END=624 /DNA_ORIENTATION=-